MTGILVRPAAVADAEAIARVRIDSWRAAYRGIVPDAVLDGYDLAAETTTWRERLATPGPAHVLVACAGGATAGPAHVLVACAGGATAVVGFATAGPGRHDGEGGLGEVWAIYVDPAAQGRGAGRALMDAAVRDLASRGFREAVLWVFVANTSARGFYEHLGWAPDGAAKAFAIGGAAPIEVRYRKPLG